MLSAIGRKLLQLGVVFVVVTFFTVVLMSLVPGKPEVLIIPFSQSNTPGETAQEATAKARQEFREDNNLDRALPVQWAKWAGKFVSGDLGNEYGPSGTTPVVKTVKERAPVSGLLILYTQIVSLGVAVPLAVLAAYRSGGWVDKAINTMVFGFLSMPSFALALILTYVLGVKFNLVRANGYDPIGDGLVLHLKSIFVPVVSLSLAQIAVYMRVLRSDLVATLQEDFILMAKSKGISNRRVLWRHALRPSSLTLLTVAGLNIGTLIGGTLVVEELLGIPGMGQAIAYAIGARQYVALQSYVALIAIFFVGINFLVDLLYTVLDPRIRERSA